VAAQTVESFSLCLEGFAQVLQAEQPIEWVETRLLAKLISPIRLLRWAIVKVETTPAGQTYWCEGAYLKSCQ
jgi:hypothetical protein